MMNLPVSCAPQAVSAPSALSHPFMLQLVQGISRFWPGGQVPTIPHPRVMRAALTSLNHAGLLPGRPEVSVGLQLRHQPLYDRLLS